MFEGLRLLKRGRKTARRTDSEEIGVFRAHVRKGEAVFDVGANKGGYMACLAPMVGSSGLCVAFEPIPELARRLEKAARGLRWPQVEVCAAAASDEDSTAMLVTPNGDMHWESSLEHNAAPGATSQEVRTIRLDRYMEKLDGRRLSAIKIDVEGHESSVVRGGMQLLKRHRPLVLAEVEARHRPDRDPGVFFQEMVELGYEGSFLRHGRREPLDTFDAERDQAPGADTINNFSFEPR